MTFIKKYWIIIVIVFGFSIFIKPALCFFILGSLALYLSFESIIFLRSIRRKGIRCTGSVLEFETDSDGDKTPVIEFTTSTGEVFKGKPFVYTSTDLSKLMSYKNMINQPISLLYEPGNPEKFVLTDENGFGFLALALFIMVGLFFIGFSICAFLGYVRLD